MYLIEPNESIYGSNEMFDETLSMLSLGKQKMICLKTSICINI